MIYSRLRQFIDFIAAPVGILRKTALGTLGSGTVAQSEVDGLAATLANVATDGELQALSDSINAALALKASKDRIENGGGSVSVDGQGRVSAVSQGALNIQTYNSTEVNIQPGGGGQVNIGTSLNIHGNSLNVGDDGFQMGLTGGYRFLQSFGGVPLSINPVGNNVVVGGVSALARLHVVNADPAQPAFITQGAPGQSAAQHKYLSSLGIKQSGVTASGSFFVRDDDSGAYYRFRVASGVLSVEAITEPM